MVENLTTTLDTSLSLIHGIDFFPSTLLREVLAEGRAGVGLLSTAAVCVLQLSWFLLVLFVVCVVLGVY